jgi:hypothetical protein
MRLVRNPNGEGGWINLDAISSIEPWLPDPNNKCIVRFTNGDNLPIDRPITKVVEDLTREN